MKLSRRGFLLGATSLTAAAVLPSNPTSSAEVWATGDGVALFSTAHPMAGDFTTANMRYRAVERFRINWNSFKAIGICNGCGGIWSVKSMTSMVSPKTRQVTGTFCRECRESMIDENALVDAEIEIVGSRGA